MSFFVIEVTNNDFHQGEPITPEDVKVAIEGYWCSVECETRSFKVISIEPFETKNEPD